MSAPAACIRPCCTPCCTTPLHTPIAHPCCAPLLQAPLSCCTPLLRTCCACSSLTVGAHAAWGPAHGVGEAQQAVVQGQQQAAQGQSDCVQLSNIQVPPGKDGRQSNDRQYTNKPGAWAPAQTQCLHAQVPCHSLAKQRCPKTHAWSATPSPHLHATPSPHLRRGGRGRTAASWPPAAGAGAGACCLRLPPRYPRRRRRPLTARPPLPSPLPRQPQRRLRWRRLFGS